jgi:hypothetical protein
MKMKIVLFCLIVYYFGCNIEKKEVEQTVEKIEQDSIIRPDNVSNDAWLVNMGFVDKPIFAWVEYVGNYTDNRKIYPHIYQFRYLYHDDKSIDTLNYEWNKGRYVNIKLELNNFKGYSFKLFPGDATIQLKNEENELFLFNVIENHKFDNVFRGISYFRIPTVKIDSIYPEYGLSTDYETRINLEQTEKGAYTVNLIDDKGIRAFMYKMNEDCRVTPTKISYLNKENGHIYYIEKDCYLELVDKKDLDKF